MDRLEKYTEAMKAIATEERTAHTWKYCTEELLVRGGGGALTGFAAAVLMFKPGRSIARGTSFGLFTGLGIGSAYEQCNERFIALQRAGNAAPVAAPSTVGAPVTVTTVTETTTTKKQ